MCFFKIIKSTSYKTQKVEEVKMKYLIISNVIIWLGIGGYLFFLAMRTKKLEKKIKQMELLNNE